MRDKKYFYALDAVRFFAAMSVAIFHLGFWITVPGATPERILGRKVDFSAVAGVAWLGWVGVEVFFVVSGFVIANSAVGSTTIQFLKSRILRLYPAVWICASFTLLALLASSEPLPSLLPKYLHTLALLPNDTWIGWIDGVYWTLAIEISFYLAVMVTLISAGRLTLPLLAWILTASSLVFLGVAHRTNVSGALVQIRYGCLFAVGIWIWLASAGHMTVARWAGLFSSIAVGALEVAIHSPEFGTGRSALWPVSVWLVTTTVIFLIACHVHAFVPISERTKHVLRKLGLMTYPLYLIHDVVGARILRLLLNSSVNRWLALGISIISVGILAFVISEYFEPRVRRVLRHLLTNQRVLRRAET